MVEYTSCGEVWLVAGTSNTLVILVADVVTKMLVDETVGLERLREERSFVFALLVRVTAVDDRVEVVAEDGTVVEEAADGPIVVAGEGVTDTVIDKLSDVVEED